MSESNQEVKVLKEEIVFEGKIGAVVSMSMSNGAVYEQFRRPPGTRMIIISPDNKLLVSKEFRHETGSDDYRLPGGKVFDSFRAYWDYRSDGGDLAEAAVEGVKNEALEETGLIIKDPELITRDIVGSTVEWDLYYFLVRDFEESQTGQALEHGEHITTEWLSIDEVKALIATGKMTETRSTGVLLGLVLPKL